MISGSGRSPSDQKGSIGFQPVACSYVKGRMPVLHFKWALEDRPLPDSPE